MTGGSCAFWKGAALVCRVASGGGVVPKARHYGVPKARASTDPDWHAAVRYPS